MLQLEFDSTIIEWRGPAPFFFAALPAADCARIAAVARQSSYGWGVIPVEAELAGFAFTTSLFPRDGRYLLPLKAALRKATQVTLGDSIHVRLTVIFAARPR